MRRLIFERFGKFWGAFSVIDLFVLNGLTIVTEFIGISLALDYLGVSKGSAWRRSAVVIMAAASTGDFRRFERFSLALCVGSLLLVPVFLMVHPPMGTWRMVSLIPQLPKGGKLSDVMLLIIAIVGTTIAPVAACFSSRATSSTSASRRASSATSGWTCGSASFWSSSAQSR